jgi:hypothetical protein
MQAALLFLVWPQIWAAQGEEEEKEEEEVVNAALL